MLSFDEIISFESLYRAHRRARLGKRHKREVVQFEAQLSENLWALHYDLKYGRYQVDGYHKFMIFDPKEREIQAISYRDRIVQHTLCDNYLMPLLDRYLIYDNVACRKDKGGSFAISRLRKFMCAHYKEHGRNGYFVKIDVSKYFPSIDHGRLKQKLARIVDDDKIFILLCGIIDSYEGEAGKGLPMGNQSSQCFALLYLNDFDRFFKERLRVKYYLRYMDDIVMLVPQKGMAQACLTRAAELLQKENLCINPKSQIVAVKQGINFIGWNFKLSATGGLLQGLTAHARRYICARAKTAYLRTKNVTALKASYNGYLAQGKTYQFRKKICEILESNGTPPA